MPTNKSQLWLRNSLGSRTLILSCIDLWMATSKPLLTNIMVVAQGDCKITAFVHGLTLQKHQLTSFECIPRNPTRFSTISPSQSAHGSTSSRMISIGWVFQTWNSVMKYEYKLFGPMHRTISTCWCSTQMRSKNTVWALQMDPVVRLRNFLQRRIVLFVRFNLLWHQKNPACWMSNLRQHTMLNKRFHGLQRCSSWQIILIIVAILLQTAKSMLPVFFFPLVS